MSGFVAPFAPHFRATDAKQTSNEEKFTHWSKVRLLTSQLFLKHNLKSIRRGSITLMKQPTMLSRYGEGAVSYSGNSSSGWDKLEKNDRIIRVTEINTKLYKIYRYGRIRT